MATATWKDAPKLIGVSSFGNVSNVTNKDGLLPSPHTHKREGFIAIISLPIPAFEVNEYEQWLIGFLPEEQALSFFENTDNYNTSGARVIGSIYSTHIMHDIGIIQDVLDPHPLIPNMYMINTEDMKSGLLEISSMAAMKEISKLRQELDVSSIKERIESDARKKLLKRDEKIARLEDNIQILRSQLEEVKGGIELSMSHRISLEFTNKELRKELRELEKKLTPRDTTGYVYLLKVIGHDTLYKIGRTNNPDNRLRTFNVKLPFPVEYDHLIETENMYQLERKLHRKFKKQRKRGSEFFTLSQADIDYIKSL